MSSLVSAIKPTFPDREMIKSHIFSGNRLVVIETSYLAFGDCICDQFHFLIPLAQAPVLRMENKLHTLGRMSVFPCNPMQLHRIEDTGITDFKALILYIENTLFRSVAEEVCGNGNIEMRSCCFLFTPAINRLLETFMLECRTVQPGSSLMLDSISVQLSILLLREGRHNLSDKPFGLVIAADERAVRRATEYINDNYMNKITLFDLARETNYSPYHFLRLFKRHTGRTPFEYLMDIKIEKAAEMLGNTDYSISQICDLCGFGSLSYFSRIFKAKTGLPPSRYRNGKPL